MSDLRFYFFFLDSLPPGNFSPAFLLSVYFFFKINFFEKLFQEYDQSVKQFESRPIGYKT